MRLYDRIFLLILSVSVHLCLPFKTFSEDSSLFKFPENSGIGCLVSTTGSVLVSTKPESSGAVLNFNTEREKVKTSQQENLTKIKKLKRQIKNLKKSASSSQKSKKTLAKKKSQLKTLTKLDKAYSSILNAITACENGTLAFVPCSENSTPCDDGNECTLGDFCQDNKCIGNPLTLTFPKECGVGACLRTVSICLNGIPGVCTPGTPSNEICNNIDDDCNGLEDDGLDCGDSNGSCPVGQFNCNGTCTFTSSDPANCGSCGFNCGVGNSCNSGICKKVLGQSCQSFSDCQSNICTDGVCCDKACGGFCVSCNQTGKLGTCSPHPAGTDPDNNCTAFPPATCSFDGMCDGNSACRLHPAGTVCISAACVQSDLQNPDTCDGVGHCNIDGGTVNCAPYFCSNLSCNTNCATDNDCLSAYFCNAPICTLSLPHNSQCTRNEMCSSGRCIGGLCDGP